MKALKDSNMIVKCEAAYCTREQFDASGKPKVTIVIAMEYCAGGSVHDLMKALRNIGEPFNEKNVAQVCYQVLQALKFLHAKKGRKYIHRDIKARNIMVTKDGECKLSDFGISFIKRNTRDKARTMGKGTEHWMAPEVLDKDTHDVEGRYDWQADIWSLGITAVEMLAPDAPFFNTSPQWLRENVKDMDTPMDILPENVEFTSRASLRAFKNFLAKCLEKDMRKRKSAAELLEDGFIKTAGMMEEAMQWEMAELVEKSLPFLKEQRRTMGIWSEGIFKRQQSIGDSETEEKSDATEITLDDNSADAATSRARRLSQTKSRDEILKEMAIWAMALGLQEEQE